MSVDDPTTGSTTTTEPVRRRDLAVARSLDSARLRSEGRVQRFLDAGFELLARAESGKEFTVQEVVDRSGQSLRSPGCRRVRFEPKRKRGQERIIRTKQDIAVS